MFGQGISKEGDILDLASNLDIIQKSGAWFAYNGEKIGQGRENAKQYLKDNPLICEEIEKKIRAHFTPEPETEATPDEKAPAQKTKKENDTE